MATNLQASLNWVSFPADAVYKFLKLEQSINYFDLTIPQVEVMIKALQDIQNDMITKQKDFDEKMQAYDVEDSEDIYVPEA